MITSMMYHYVRPVEDSQLRYLAVNDFTKQLDWLQKNVGNFLTESEWESAKSGKPSEGVLLTFDDGLKDHVEHVLPILQERNIFAIFFVSTLPLVSKNMLAVHLTHKLLSLGRSEEILDFFRSKLPSAVWGKLNFGIAANAYTKHLDLDVNVTIKKIINYLFTDFELSEVLDSASDKFLSNTLTEISESWYLSDQDLRLISNAGMKIGSHASTHKLLSLLNRDQIFDELSESRSILEGILGKVVDEFCYPYGGIHSYNKNVREALIQLKYSVAHDVAPRKISRKDLEERYQLPRFNCNELPFGRAHSLKY
jgi:peptidoglycan/xylan/chitin deacetylase (PgdA/CDA1 family)